MFLTIANLVVLTGKVRYTAQARALARMGIDHRIRPDGFPLVLEKVLTPDLAKGKLSVSEPDWSAL